MKRELLKSVRVHSHTWARKYRYATRENISHKKMGRNVMTLYFAVLIEFPGRPSNSFPPVRCTMRGPGGPFPFFFPLPFAFPFLGSASSSLLWGCVNNEVSNPRRATPTGQLK